MTEDPAVVRLCAAAFEAVWERAIDHSRTTGPPNQAPVPADMAISPSSSVQQAGQELAARLREIRLDAGLTARALSRSPLAGTNPRLADRARQARRRPTADIRAWCQICGAETRPPT